MRVVWPRAWALVALVVALGPNGASAEEAKSAGAEELATAAQNPVADLISVPLQNNILFGVGPEGDTANVLNIQPVIPVSLGGWNVITRTIIPVVYLPDLIRGLPDVPENIPRGDEFGLGDINVSAFLSPAASRPVIWGIGPSLGLRTATSPRLGSGKWTAGPSAVALITPKSWVVGALVRNLWSYGGASDRKSVNSFLLQPFINYNFKTGWYLTTSPLVTANWQAGTGNRWTLPLGGGVGKIARLGSQPINLQVQAFGNVVRPDAGPDWSLRLQAQFLFPR